MASAKKQVRVRVHPDEEDAKVTFEMTTAMMSPLPRQLRDLISEHAPALADEVDPFCAEVFAMQWFMRVLKSRCAQVKEDNASLRSVNTSLMERINAMQLEGIAFVAAVQTYQHLNKVMRTAMTKMLLQLREFQTKGQKLTLFEEQALELLTDTCFYVQRQLDDLSKKQRKD